MSECQISTVRPLAVNVGAVGYRYVYFTVSSLSCISSADLKANFGFSHATARERYYPSL